MKMDPNSVQLNKRLSGFCRDCTVLYGKADTHFDNGTRAGFDAGGKYKALCSHSQSSR
jgi:hypothetical protein